MARTKEERIADRAARRETDPRPGSVAAKRAERAANTPAPTPSPTEVRQERRETNRPNVNQTVSKASDYKFDQYRKGSVNSSEISNLRKQGQSRDEIRAAAEASGLRLGKSTEKKFARWDERAKARADAKERAQEQINKPAVEPPTSPVHEYRAPTPTPTPTPTPSPTPDPIAPPVRPRPTVPTPEGPDDGTNIETPTVNLNPVQDNDMTQEITQDNDITTNIDGDGNYVYNNQDNSIRQYGGDNRQFTYVGGQGGSGVETPASMATLGGYYDVDDSPAKQAKFVDLHTTLNRDNQKRYAGTSHIAQGAIARARQNQTIDVNALDKRIYEREMYSRAKADMMGMNLFGDMHAMTPPDWQSPERQSEVEKPDFEKMYDTYTDF